MASPCPNPPRHSLFAVWWWAWLVIVLLMPPTYLLSGVPVAYLLIESGLFKLPGVERMYLAFYAPAEWCIARSDALQAVIWKEHEILGTYSPTGQIPSDEPI